MATTLSPRALERAAIQSRRMEITRAVAAVEDAALRHGLPHTLPTLRVIGQVWLAHPDGPLPYPSQETLAGRIGRTARTVRRHIAALEAAGLLAVFRTCARPGGGGRLVRRSNRYQFRDRVATALRACPLPRRRRSHLEDTRVPRPPDRGAAPAPPPPINTSPAPTIDMPTAEDAPEDLVDVGQVVAEWRTALAQARRSTR
jgi:DNA-binding MarR family transcriptional regulator